MTDTWDKLFQQLIIILGKMFEKLVEDAMSWSLLIVWLALCLFAINWKKVWPILAQGAWMPLTLTMVLVALAWSQMTPAAPHFWWKLGGVTLVVVASFFCGWVQIYFGWQPAEINLEPAPHAPDGHAHHSVPTPHPSHGGELAAGHH